MPFLNAPRAWVTNLRKIALIAGVTLALSLASTMWNVVRAQSERPAWMWCVAAFTLLISAILPAFCIALYRNEGSLCIPKRLRRMSLAAAITLSIILAEGLPRHIESFASYWAAMKLLDWRGGAITLWIAARDARSFNQAVTVLGELTNLAWILLLVAVFRQSDSNRDGSISRQLALESKMATMTWGLILTGYVVGLLLTPYRYSETRHLALQLGRQPPPFMDLVTSGTRGVLIQACFFIAPYIVYRSRSKPEGLEATSPRR